MRIIGITGGIASGKSTACQYIKDQGYRVFDADAASRALTARGGKALPIIAERFGSRFIKNGALDRELMSLEVFSDKEKRKMLEDIIHPLVIAESKQYVLDCANEQLCFLDVPLLFESGMDSLCDEVWLVSSPVNERIRRLGERSGMKPDEAKRRIRSQMPEYKKRRLAHHIIDSSGALERTRARIDRLLAQALKKEATDEKRH